MIPDYEAMLQAFYERLLVPGDRAVDAGAHVGRHTLPIARRVAPGGRVWAFEPLEECRASLCRAVAEAGLASVVEVHAEALGERPGRAEFVVALDAPAYSGLQERVYDVPTRLRRVPVEVVTLNDALEGQSPAYLKVDAEGGEYHILRGAERLLARCRPVVSFEFGVNSLGHYGVTPEDMGAFWNARDYRLWDILGHPLEVSGAFEASARNQAVWDYVAFPAERAGEAGALLGAGQAGPR